MKILAGIETEYGLEIQGRGPGDQVEDSADFVRSYPGRSHLGWDYRYESPRADLRGFSVERLAVDPQDAIFEKKLGPEWAGREIRSDTILPCGARFYNDHGHPEFATPECWSIQDLVRYDRAGEWVVRQTANQFERATGLEVALYKNNTDFHGASFGTHESYLVPRELGLDRLLATLLPMMVLRPILCGAGKVGSETSAPCDYQLSQRADFFMETANVETLYRRPIFNLRDEPHADSSKWIRLHVICGDANMNPVSTQLKIGLLKMGIHLAAADRAPVVELRDPVVAASLVSRAPAGRVSIDGHDSYDMLRQLLTAFLGLDCGDEELVAIADLALLLLRQLEQGDPEVGQSIDWFAKHRMIDEFRISEGLEWADPWLQSLDLAYSDIRPDHGLFFALAEQSGVPLLDDDDELERLANTPPVSRAWTRGQAVATLGDRLRQVSWSALEWESDGKVLRAMLDPRQDFVWELDSEESVRMYNELVARLNPHA
jgi:proteasome accessory factor A